VKLAGNWSIDRDLRLGAPMQDWMQPQRGDGAEPGVAGREQIALVTG
jgi:hypothetical protein